MNEKDRLKWCDVCKSETSYTIKMQKTMDGQLLDHYCSKCGNFLFFLYESNKENDNEYEN